MSRWYPATLLVLAAIAGCSGSTKPDATPPATVSDLSVILVHDSSATLTWTAPGDDGLKGQAAGYDLRVATFSVVANWNLATRVTAPVPGPSGGTDSAVVSGLDAGVSYNFALRAVDDAGNWSDISNMAEGVPVDTIPPAPVTDLAVRLETPVSVTLSWTAPGDDGQAGMPFSYDVRYATEPITEATWGTASVANVPIAPGTAGTLEEMTIWPLQSETVYYFALKTTDERENTSGLSNVAEIETGTTHVWRILPDGTGDAPTVQAGIDSAGNGDLVLVEPGTYYENINLRGKEIHLKGDLGPTVTILDGTYGDSSVVVCDSEEDNRTIIEGLTIANGKGTPRVGDGRIGGGIFCSNAAPVIRDDIIRDNRAESPPGGNFSWGGGVAYYSDSARLVVEYCLIENNFASTNGGGLHLGAQCIVRNSEIIGNSTNRGDGGGIRMNVISGQVLNNIFASNVAGDHGGAVYTISRGGERSVELAGNVFVGNSALGIEGISDCSGGAIWAEGGAHIHENSIIYNYAKNVTPPAGGGICLLHPATGMLVERNVIVGNTEGGLVLAQLLSSGTWGAIVRRNLFYANSVTDIHNNFPESITLTLDDNLFENPLLCILGVDSRGEVADNSPALLQPYGVIGAVPVAGCGPE